MTTPAHILIVDDEPAVRAVLREGLRLAGYDTSEASGQKSLFQSLKVDPVALITLDLDLGDDDGLEIAREIRARRNVPIIMITGKHSPYDRIKGLEYGSDDYITKPFHIREVVLRVQKLLARYDGHATGQADELQHRLTCRAGTLDPIRREFRDTGGNIIHLTSTEFALLHVFLKHPARVLSREELSRWILGKDWSPLDRVIDGHVARLRRKVELSGEAPTLIKSVRGVGYVFAGVVERD